MSEHRATIRWSTADRPFGPDGYDRTHTWSFPGGATVEASAAPDYAGDPALVDPEEAFVAALSSCHMLTFLALAAKKRLSVARYEDEAVGTLAKDDAGRLAVTAVELRPLVEFSGDAPDEATLTRIHERAHAHCFIASSVRTAIEIRPRSSEGQG